MVAAGVDGMGVVSIPRRAGVVRSMRAPTGAARSAARELERRPSIPPQSLQEPLLEEEADGGENTSSAGAES